MGIDYGTDSVRVLIVNLASGTQVSQAVAPYKRWMEGKYCDPGTARFRQHPQDYLDALEMAMGEAIHQTGQTVSKNIVGIGIDTTGSTPVAVNKEGIPLALLSEFSENPNAMFVLWKDHTAIEEAQEINDLCARWEIDYTKYCGGIYSSEWFWAKILHITRRDPRIADAAYSWAEHCDWLPFVLTGGKDIKKMLRSRCAAGHKALWHPEWSGLPAEEFLGNLDPRLAVLRSRLYQDTFTADHSAGFLSTEWSDKLGLPQGIAVAVGAFDAHMGAVGGQIQPYFLSKVMGTSTCDMLIIPQEEKEHLVRGICGQVSGSIIPGMLGLEAGQSAFGDVYAWFRDLMLWPVKTLLGKADTMTSSQKEQWLSQSKNQMLSWLTEAAERIDPNVSSEIALDWLNGRRTPDADQSLKAAIIGLDLASDTPRIFRALIEATCFGARAIVERFENEGIQLRGIIGLGGVSQKSPLVMQIMADVLNMSIKVAKAEQTCALGAAMFGAVAAGSIPSVEDAMEQMGSGFSHTYEPRAKYISIYEKKYQDYCKLGAALA